MYFNTNKIALTVYCVRVIRIDEEEGKYEIRFACVVWVCVPFRPTNIRVVSILVVKKMNGNKLACTNFFIFSNVKCTYY